MNWIDTPPSYNLEQHLFKDICLAEPETMFPVLSRSWWSRRRVNRCPRHCVPAGTVDPDVYGGNTLMAVGAATATENRQIYRLMSLNVPGYLVEK